MTSFHIHLQVHFYIYVIMQIISMNLPLIFDVICWCVGKFYLVDSGYPNRPVYLAPYKGTKYHLLKYQNDPLPKGIKETFNYAHSSLWNAIERSFGVLKMKWRILLDLPSFPMSKQSKIITACMALHNFIREMAVSNEDFYMYVRVESIFQWPRHLPLNHVLAISI